MTQPGFRPELIPDAARIRAYRARQSAASSVCLGVISNPFSRTNARTRIHDRLLPRFLPDRRNSIDTRTIQDLDTALRTLLFERGVNVLGLNGGDGTLHLGVNRLLALAEACKAKTGENLPLPRLLFLNGGTLNIVSRAAGTKGNPVRTVRRFVQATRNATLGRLQVRTMPLLRVEPENGTVRHGFVYGSEVVANALEMYGLFGEGYVGLGRFLSEFVLGYAVHTRLWQEHGWKLDPPTTAVRVDEIAYAPYLAAVAATIDLSILQGAITAFRVPEGAPGFFVKVLQETQPGKIIRLVPRLLLNQPHASIHNLCEATELRSCGGYTLDGEVFLDRSSQGRNQSIVVRRSVNSVQAVRPLG